MSKQHECTEEQLLNDVESHMMRPKMQANNTEVKPIFPESEEAAKFVTGISGWMDRNWNFWGTDEKLARYSGSTHKHCKCGAGSARPHGRARIETDL